MNSEKQLDMIEKIIELALVAGMHLDYDNSGQIVLYTNVTSHKRHSDGRWAKLDKIAYLPDHQVENNDFHVRKS